MQFSFQQKNRVSPEILLQRCDLWLMPIWTGSSSVLRSASFGTTSNVSAELESAQRVVKVLIKPELEMAHFQDWKISRLSKDFHCLS